MAGLTVLPVHSAIKSVWPVLSSLVSPQKCSVVMSSSQLSSWLPVQCELPISRDPGLDVSVVLLCSVDPSYPRAHPE